MYDNVSPTVYIGVMLPPQGECVILAIQSFFSAPEHTQPDHLFRPLRRTTLAKNGGVEGGHLLAPRPPTPQLQIHTHMLASSAPAELTVAH